MDLWNFGFSTAHTLCIIFRNIGSTCELKENSFQHIVSFDYFVIVFGKILLIDVLEA